MRARTLAAATGAALLVAMAPAVPGGDAMAPAAVPGGDVAATVPLPGCVVPGVDDRCESWAVVDDPEPDPAEPYQQPSALAVSPDGGLVVAAGYGAQDLFDTGGEADSRWRVLGLDATTGAERWLARPGPTGSYARPLDVTVTADGATVLATGYASSAFGARDAALVVVALDAATGAVRWERQVTGDVVAPGVADVRGWYVAEAADGRVVVAGSHRRAQPAGAQGVQTMLFEADGALVDVVLAPATPASGVTVPAGLVLDAAGATAAVVATSDGVGELDIDMYAYGVRLDRDAGSRVVWHRRHDGRGTQAPDRVEAVAATPDGQHVAVAGISGNDPDGPPFDVDYATTTLLLEVATGRLVWESRLEFDDPFVVPTGMAAADDRLVLAVNRDTDAGSRPGLVTLGRADGGVLADVTLPATTLDAEGVSDVAFVGERVVVTGRSPSLTNAATGSYLVRADAVTAAVDAATGDRVWSARYRTSGTSDDRGLRLATDGAGNAYVLGGITNGVEFDENFYDLSVLAYRVE